MKKRVNVNLMLQYNITMWKINRMHQLSAEFLTCGIQKRIMISVVMI